MNAISINIFRLAPRFLNSIFNFRDKKINFVQKMSIFTQSFDPITGCAVWEEKHPDYDYHQEVARSAFADMLHDTERNQKYYVALQKAIEKMHQKGQKANVLDIGTGTGLLSMMAARCGADTITACEAFRAMAECAEKVIKRNGLEDRIKLVKKKSTLMKIGDNGDMLQKANILVTEVFDTELIGEGALLTFQHALKELLEPDCIVVPHSAIVWAQVVESPTVLKWNRINHIKDTKTDEILLKTPISISNCPGSSAVHDIQLSQLPLNSFKPLLNSQPIFRFDWSGKQPLISNEVKSIESAAISSGTAHAIFMWWELAMDEEKEIILSCAPVWEHPESRLNLSTLMNGNLSTIEIASKIPWRDHWMQAIYYIPQEIPIKMNEKIILVGAHDEFSFWFDLKKSETDQNNFVINSPICNCSLHLAYSRTRIAQLNDQERNNKYIDVLKKCVNMNTEILCVSDGCLIALVAGILGAKKLTIYEPNTLSKRVIESFIECNDLKCEVQIIEEIDKFKWSQENDRLVVGDPYYVNSIFPWDNLRFWYLISTYAPNVMSIPMAVRIRGVIVELQDLHKIRAPVEICEGFQLNDFDKLIHSSSEISDCPVEVHPLWEYPNRALSAVFDVASYKMSDEFLSTGVIEYSGRVPLLTNGRCNGIALWVDWYLDPETVISTGPTAEIQLGKHIAWNMYHRQGVCLFHETKNVTDQNALTWTFKYRHGNDEYFDFKYKIDG